MKPCFTVTAPLLADSGDGGCARPPRSRRAPPRPAPLRTLVPVLFGLWGLLRSTHRLLSSGGRRAVACGGRAALIVPAAGAYALQLALGGGHDACQLRRLVFVEGIGAGSRARSRGRARAPLRARRGTSRRRRTRASRRARRRRACACVCAGARGSGRPGRRRRSPRARAPRRRRRCPSAGSARGGRCRRRARGARPRRSCRCRASPIDGMRSAPICAPSTSETASSTPLCQVPGSFASVPQEVPSAGTPQWCGSSAVSERAAVVARKAQEAARARVDVARDVGVDHRRPRGDQLDEDGGADELGGRHRVGAGLGRRRRRPERGHGDEADRHAGLGEHHRRLDAVGVLDERRDRPDEVAHDRPATQLLGAAGDHRRHLDARSAPARSPCTMP